MTHRLLTLLTLLLFTVLPLAGQAQSTFTLEFEVTELVEDELNDLFIYHGVITNTTDQERIYQLEFLVDEADTPDGWTFQWCTHFTCFAPFLSTVYDTLDPGQVDDILSFDVGAWTDAGIGHMPTRIFDIDNPDEVVETTFFLADAADAPEARVITRPVNHALDSVYPNPFNAAANVRFTLAAPADARVTLHDVTGRQVLELVNGTLPAGQHTRSLKASSLASGPYFVRMAAQGQTFVQPITLVK